MGKKSTKSGRKQIANSKSKSLFISNCFTCKWVKLSNQNTETGGMNKKVMIDYIQSTHETHLRSNDTNTNRMEKDAEKGTSVQEQPTEGRVQLRQCQSLNPEPQTLQETKKDIMLAKVP